MGEAAVVLREAQEHVLQRLPVLHKTRVIQREAKLRQCCEHLTDRLAALCAPGGKRAVFLLHLRQTGKPGFYCRGHVRAAAVAGKRLQGHGGQIGI